MAPTLYAHPFSSYCQKVLIALYENDTPFQLRMLGPEDQGAGVELEALWPLKRFPVLVEHGRTILEASIIIEHLELHHPGGVRLIPENAEAALDARMMDRVFDNYVMTPMQKLVFDQIRPEGDRDAYGVAEARATLDRTYGWLDRAMAKRTWAAGEAFSLADCAAAPSLFYADWAHEINGAFMHLRAYRSRLLSRPSFARAVEEARPYRAFFPIIPLTKEARGDRLLAGTQAQARPMTVDLTNPIFHDEDAARGWLERSRWGASPACAHCGSVNVSRMQGTAHRAGLLTCRDCNKQFSVTVGTVMERSHISLPKWVLGFHLMSASKKGMSSLQLSRMLDVTYKTAWFMSHRIREAMTETNPAPLGGEGKIVEADEAYHGKKETPVPSPNRQGRPYIKKGKAAEKRTIIALVERRGEVRVAHLKGRVTASNVRDILVRNADRKSRLHTDESRLYPGTGSEFATHETVNHGAKEYARGDVTTNSVEGFFGIFKRGLNGNYQHCSEQHFQRYLNEFAFRYNNRIKLGVDDTSRAIIAARGAEGKRLTYRRTYAA